MNANEEKILYEIAWALKTIADKLDTVAAKQDNIVTKIDAVATKLQSIDGHLNPLYQADYTAPEAES